MALDMACMLYLQEKGHLTAEKNKLLDVGPQNVYGCTEQQIRSFVRRQGGDIDDAALDVKAKWLADRSTPRPEQQTTMFSEIAELANIEYHAFDVCPAPKTEIFDLNFDSLPDRHREHYDVVLNCGTTEHILNQWNSFAAIHDATKVGGIIYCILPATGYLDHGYFCYTPVFFKDTARANRYEIVDQFLAQGADTYVISQMGLDVRGDGKFLQPHSGKLTPAEDTIPSLNAHVVMRKTKSAPFHCALDVATAHSVVDRQVAIRYRHAKFDEREPLQRECARLEIENEELQRICKRLECEKEARVRERDGALTERDEARAQWNRFEIENEELQRICKRLGREN